MFEVVCLYDFFAFLEVEEGGVEGDNSDGVHLYMFLFGGDGWVGVEVPRRCSL